MECNRDEAIRAKTIAEKKLVDKDFAGAKKFSLKAQTLYPELDGISQMLVTLDVYISSENKVNGESDWYGILDVKPSDDDEMIRKQYRKLVLMLHPDKNKSVGADGAFKILSEAWGVLSDKSKRSAYNQRRHVRGFQQKVSFQSHRSSSSSSSSSPSVNVVHRSATKPTSKPKTAPAPARVPVRPKPQPPPPAPVRRSDSFWTFCHQCKMHYEYFKVHLNCTILCPSCQKPFRAVEVPIPKNFPKPTSRRGLSKIHLNPGSRAKVQFTDCPSGASMGDDKCKRECEDFNAQRLSKRRKNNEDSSDVKVPN